MNTKILAVVIVIVLILSGTLFFLNSSKSDTQVEVEKQYLKDLKSEKSTKVASTTEIEVAEVVKEEIETVEQSKVEVVKKIEIPNGFEEVSNEEMQVVEKNSINLDAYTEIYDYEKLNIYIDKKLNVSMKKSKKENLSLLIIKHIHMGTVFIKNDEENRIYLEVLEYKNFKQMGNGEKFAKSKHVYHFEFNKSQVKESENIELFFNDLNAAIKDGDAKNLILVGYTDSRGTQEYNTFLAYKRAQVFTKRLSEYNIAVKYILRGESNPVASNKTAEGRAQNRRVEMFLGF